MPRAKAPPSVADDEPRARLTRVTATHPNGTLLALIVAPSSSVNAIDRIEGDVLRVRIAAPPVAGAANAALLRYLATTLSVPRSSLRLIAGHGGRRKRLLIADLTTDEVCRRLAPHLRP